MIFFFIFSTCPFKATTLIFFKSFTLASLKFPHILPLFWISSPILNLYDFDLQKSGDYLAIPITVNVVLIISDTLLIWASASKNKLLLWPWIILHCLEWLFFIAMLIYLMVIVPKTGFKVVVSV